MSRIGDELLFDLRPGEGLTRDTALAGGVARRLGLRVGLLPGAAGQVAGDRLGDGFAQAPGIVGERVGIRARERAVVGEAEVGEDERPQLVVEAGPGPAFALEIVDAGEEGDILLREVPQRPSRARMLVADRLAPVGDAAPGAEEEGGFLPAREVADGPGGGRGRGVIGLIAVEGVVGV